jgi:ribose transport system permease protein
VNSFIATLGMGSILAALQVIVTGSGQPVQPTSTVWNDISQRSVGGFQLVVLYLLVLAAIVWWIMDYTPFGRHLYAVGGNANAARLSGVRTGRLSWISLIMSAGLASLAGVFFTSQSGPSLSFGATLLLPAFAAAFLGSTQLFPGRFNVWGTILSIYVLATGVEGLQLISGQQWLSNMFDGVALIVAVGLAVWQTSSSSTRRKKVKPSSLAGADGSLPIDQGEREPAVLSPPDGG